MFDKEMESLRLRDMAIKLFVKKDDVDCTQANVISAIATAASEMAINSGIVSREEVFDTMVDVFGALGNGEIGFMSPGFVPQIIGYSVQFMDFGSAMSNYNAQKAEYDAFYKEVNYYNMNKGKTL